MPSKPKLPNVYHPLKIGGESFLCGVRKTWNGKEKIPFVPLPSVAHWLGPPYDVRDIRGLVAKHSVFETLSLDIDGCGLSLSPFGITLLVYLLDEPEASAEQRQRAAHLLVNWWLGRDGNIKALNSAFPSTFS